MGRNITVYIQDGKEWKALGEGYFPTQVLQSIQRCVDGVGDYRLAIVPAEIEQTEKEVTDAS